MGPLSGATDAYGYNGRNEVVSARRTLGGSPVAGFNEDFAYDAAGRLVKEGSKTYRYGYLDKVLSVTDGKSKFIYDYHADGQIASADYGDGNKEGFLWDGLALIQRGGERFINEPHVGNAPKKLCFEGKPRAQRSARRARKGPRGNPVVSSRGTSYFNDMLGTTLGAKAKGKYSAAALSAFGEDLSVHSPTPTHNSNFYTGKPHVEGLGHAFLFRNYRAGLAKWQTADSLGYPDGWNQLTYCGNNVVRYCDIYGGSVGDVYDTLDEAALAWAREFLDASINADREYASYFYPKDGGYSYSDPIIGEAHHVKKPFPHDPSDYGGSIHTHGAESPGYADEDFSKADKQNVNTYGKPGYLVTPSGKLKRMMPFGNPETIVNNIKE